MVLGGIENEVPGNSATDRERRHSPAYQQIYKDDEPCSPARVRTTVTPGGQQVALWLQRETGLQRERGGLNWTAIWVSSTSPVGNLLGSAATCPLSVEASSSPRSACMVAQCRWQTLGVLSFIHSFIHPLIKDLLSAHVSEALGTQRQRKQWPAIVEFTACSRSTRNQNKQKH